MKINHVLIDYENVQPAVAKALDAPLFHVWIFVGAQQAKVSFDLLDLIQRKPGAAKVIKIGSVGRNALDFHMSYCLGALVKEHPGDFFHLISRDTGMDPLVEHLRGQGIQVSRWADVSGIPILKQPAATLSDDDKLSVIIEYLVRRGAQRPATMKTLVGSIAAQFQPKLQESTAKTLAARLEALGVFELVGTKLKYGLPD